MDAASNLDRTFSTLSIAKRIAVCQMTSVADKKANISVVTELVQNASKENVQRGLQKDICLRQKEKMIFFPEACDYIAESKEEMLAKAEPIPDGQCVNAYRHLAREHGVWLSMGGLHEKDAANPAKVYNTHLIIDNRGDIVQSYRKLHLFDVEIPERGVRLRESDFTTPGGHVVTPVGTPVGKVGLATCYDMRFPELSTQLAMMGAELLTFPSAFTQATGEAHWELLLRARAIESQCYVVAAAQTGRHNDKRRSYGHALCVDPWGRVVADCGVDSPLYRIAEIKPEQLSEVRRNMPVFKHRRKDVYSLYALSLRSGPLKEHSALDETIPPVPPAAPVAPSNVFGHVRVPETCVFYRSGRTFAFVNLRCVIPGHVLVAPIRVAERNQDLSDEEATDFYRTVRLVQRLMEYVHKTQSCTVTIQDGIDAGQTVRHLHCHIMPRRKGDFIHKAHIYLELAKNDQQPAGQPTKPPRTLKEMEEEAEMLRRELNELLSSEHSRGTETDTLKAGPTVPATH